MQARSCRLHWNVVFLPATPRRGRGRQQWLFSFASVLLFREVCFAAIFECSDCYVPLICYCPCCANHHCSRVVLLSLVHVLQLVNRHILNFTAGANIDSRKKTTACKFKASILDHYPYTTSTTGILSRSPCHKLSHLILQYRSTLSVRSGGQPYLVPSSRSFTDSRVASE